MSNTNTEIVTTAYEKLQKALIQADTVLPGLEEAIETGDLQNYAKASDLEEKANESDFLIQKEYLEELVKSSVNSTCDVGDNIVLNTPTENGVKLDRFIKNSIVNLELTNSNSNKWFNANVTDITLDNNIVEFNYSGTWARNIVKITLPDELIDKAITFSFKANYTITSGSCTYVILGTTDYENVTNEFAACNENINSFATYYKDKSASATFICKTNTLLISIFPTGDSTGDGNVSIYNITINEGAEALKYVPYEGYNVYSFKPLLSISDVKYIYETNHRYIFKATEFEKDKNYCLYIPQEFTNLRITLNTNKTANVAQTIKSWGAFDGGIIKFTTSASGTYYLDIWSNTSDSEEITFDYVYLADEYDSCLVKHDSKNVELKSYLNNTVILNDYEANMKVSYWRKGFGLTFESLNYNVTSPEMYGAIGNGTSDDTEAIQKAIDNGNLIILSQKYFVSKTGTKSIAVKSSTIPISIVAPSNKIIVNLGEIYSDTIFNVFFATGDNIKFLGGEFHLGNLSTAGTYQMGAIALDHCTNVSVENVYSNNAVVTAFSSKYINTKNCISEREYDNNMNCAIGYHCCSYSRMDNNTVLGAHNDGDLLLFGNCFGNIIDGNNLFAKSDYYVNTGAQGICVDTACFKTKVINNYVTGYYNPIDVKTWANGNIISNNTLFANKQGVTIRRGEGNKYNNTDMIINNLIDLGGGNGSGSVVLGSEGLGDYTTCGVFLEGVSNVLVSGNSIYSTVDTDKAIGIMLNEIIDNGTIKIENNTFNNAYIEYQNSSNPVKYMKGIYIAVVNSSLKDISLVISKNNFKLDNEANTDIQIFNIKNIKDVRIKDNSFYGGESISSIKNCTRVFISGNEGTINNNLAALDTVTLLAFTNNTLYNVKTGLTNILDLTDVTTSVSNANTFISVDNALTGSGCAHNNDLIVTQ